MSMQSVASLEVWKYAFQDVYYNSKITLKIRFLDVEATLQTARFNAVGYYPPGPPPRAPAPAVKRDFTWWQRPSVCSCSFARSFVRLSSTRTDRALAWLAALLGQSVQWRRGLIVSAIWAALICSAYVIIRLCYEIIDANLIEFTRM